MMRLRQEKRSLKYFVILVPFYLCCATKQKNHLFNNMTPISQEPLNSEDDVTDDDPADLFDTDNVVVCQYDKVFNNFTAIYYSDK